MQGIIHYDTTVIPDLDLSNCERYNCSVLKNCLIISEKDIWLNANGYDFILSAGTHFIPNTYAYHTLTCKTESNIKIYNNAVITDNDYYNGIKYVNKYAMVYKNISNY